MKNTYNWKYKKGLRFLERVCLFFIKMQYSTDTSSPTKYTIGYKVFNGKIYILKERYNNDKVSGLVKIPQWMLKDFDRIRD